jgi:spore germination protein
VRVSAWLPHWDQERAARSVLANADLFDEVMPFWFGLTSAGSIVPYDGAEDPGVLGALRDAGVRIVPTIANGQDAAPVHAMLSSESARAAHVDDLCRCVLNNRYDGIDVDYENLTAGDRSTFSAFVVELAAALHEEGKEVGVAVYAKTEEPGTWDGPQAQDYAAIASAVDRVQVMGYDYHWQTSDPGPIGPLLWLEAVSRFASAAMPAPKVDLGVHLYGYDWMDGKAQTLTWDRAVERCTRQGAVRNWNAHDAEPWFTYDEGASTHSVWYGDARSVAARLDLAGKHRLGGVAFWCLGGEDPDVWEVVRFRR